MKPIDNPLVGRWLAKVFLITALINFIPLIYLIITSIWVNYHSSFHEVIMNLSEMFAISFLMVAVLIELIPRKIGFNLIYLSLPGSAFISLFYYFINALPQFKSPSSTIGFKYFQNIQTELISFISFTFLIFCFFNTILILKNKNLNKGYLIKIDYFYFSLGFIALLMKYFASKNSDLKIMDITAFIFGAIAVALRVTKTNAEYVLYLESLSTNK